MSLDAKRRAWAFGHWAEAFAAMWLRLKGYRVLAHGERNRGGEIDLIARRGTVVAFVEVKARRDLATAAHAIGGRQQRRIERAATAFLAARPELGALDVRFDVVLVEPWGRPVHLVDAWRPSVQ